MQHAGEKISDGGTKMMTAITLPLAACATAAVNAYGDVDKQFNLVKQSMGDTANTTTSQLFEGMSITGTICQTVEWDVKDLAALTDVFDNAGIYGAEGDNAMKTGLACSAAQAKDGVEAVDALDLATGPTFAERKSLHIAMKLQRNVSCS